MATPQKLTRRNVIATGVGVAGVAALAACSNDKPVWNGNGGGEEQTPPKAKATITSPANEAKDVPAGTEIVFASTDAVKTTFELTDAKGKAVPGEMHPDGAGWLPAKSLDYGVSYTAKMTATGDDNKPATVTSTFTTMAKPSKQISVISWLPDFKEIGVGQPLIFQIRNGTAPWAVPQDQRAVLQRRLLVKVEPFVEGVWHWYTDSEVHWRPKEFWQKGTKVFVHARVGGLSLGNGNYGRRDLTLTTTVGRSLIMKVDDRVAPKVLIVTLDGKEIRRIPVSLGRPTWESSSGTMVIVEKLAKTVFDTTQDPNARDRYKVNIEYAQRITWSGEHIHSAPWSVASQGKRNVSHGCINMSAANAKWLFQQTWVGDPVIVRNTGQKLKFGDGWTDWDKPWEEYLKGSAIPYAPPATQSPAPAVSPTAAP